MHLTRDEFPIQNFFCAGLSLKMDIPRCFVFCQQLYRGRGQRFLKSRPNHKLYFHLFMSCSTPTLCFFSKLSHVDLSGQICQSTCGAQLYVRPVLCADSIPINSFHILTFVSSLHSLCPPVLSLLTEICLKPSSKATIYVGLSSANVHQMCRKSARHSHCSHFDPPCNCYGLALPKCYN